MTSLVFPGDGYTRLAKTLLSVRDETCAILLCNTATNKRNQQRLLVREQLIPPSTAYRNRSSVSAELKPEFLVSVCGVARKNDNAVVFVHTHPGFSDVPQFSSIDDFGEQRLAEFLGKRIPHKPHAALVISQGGCSARVLGTQQPLAVSEIGAEIRFLSGLHVKQQAEAHSLYDRQVRAFGALGQTLIEQLTIGVVGFGGTGSIVVEQLAHLGAKNFVVVDPDTIEETNLNRLVGARVSDVGYPKTAVAERVIRGIQPTAKIETLTDSILRDAVALQVKDVDFLFCCTDSHGSRAVLNQIAYQYLVPCIDMGVTINAQNGVISHIFGRVQMLAPGLGCLICGAILNSEEIRRDLLTDFERKSDPYITGAHEPQPSVISLNSTVASLAVTMFLASVVGLPSKARFQLYNVISGNLRGVVNLANPMCVVCSGNGALARGDEWPLPTRRA